MGAANSSMAPHRKDNLFSSWEGFCSTYGHTAIAQHPNHTAGITDFAIKSMGSRLCLSRPSKAAGSREGPAVGSSWGRRDPVIHQQSSRAGSCPCPASCLEAITYLSLTLIFLNPLAPRHPATVQAGRHFSLRLPLSSVALAQAQTCTCTSPSMPQANVVVLRHVNFNIKITLYKNTSGD